MYYTNSKTHIKLLMLKLCIYPGLISAGIFSKLYYDNCKFIEQLPAQKIYNFPEDLGTILGTHGPMRSGSFNMKIDSKIINSNPNHLFRNIKLFEREYARVENDSWADVLTKYDDSDIIDNCVHIQDIPSKSSRIDAQFSNHKIVLSEYQFMPYIHICDHTIVSNCNFDYLNAKIYSSAPIRTLKTKRGIKDLLIDAGYPQVADEFLKKCDLLYPESSIIAYTQIIDSPTVFMNVTRAYNKDSKTVFWVQVITDDEETLIEKTIENNDYRTFFGSMVLFSLCVVVRNFLPF